MSLSAPIMALDMKYVVFYMCRTIKILKSNWPRKLKFSQFLQPDVLGVSETRLNANTTFNTELINYNIYQADSPTPAGGVALYFSKALTSFPRSDITLDMPLVESVWVEIATPKNQKPILVGCIYKHPGANIDEFNGKLDETMKLFNPNKYQLYILGDMNMDFFKCDSHPPTEAYSDML